MKTLLKLLYLALCSSILISCSSSDDSDSPSPTDPNDFTLKVPNLGGQEIMENPFVLTTDQQKSTFAIDADGGSYAIMRRLVNQNRSVPPNQVRIEEYINYFTFNYFEPPTGENVSLNSELSTCPWKLDNYLLRVGLKGRSFASSQIPGSNYVFLVDISGSMRPDSKLPLFKRGMNLLVDRLRAIDRLTIVTYSGDAKLHLNTVSGDEKDKIKASIDALKADGATAGEDGIKLAYQMAEANFISGGNNRIIVGTDGVLMWALPIYQR